MAMKKGFLFLLFLFPAGVMLAQVEPPELPPNIDTTTGVDILLDWYNVLYVALFYVIGFFHNVLPINIKDKWLRVAAFALVVGVVLFIFVTSGQWTDAISLVISFAIASGIIYPAGKSIAGIKSPAVKLTSDTQNK